MSLSNKDIENLKKKLNNNINLSSKSKTNLNAFINNKKNAFDRTAFMQAYNVKMTNLRSKESSLGKRKRPSGNLNSAMENNTGNVSGGSVNPNKNGRMSPSGTPNNGINFSSKKARFTFPFRTAAMGAANNIRMKAVANVKRKAIIDRQQGNKNAKEKAVANKVNANARKNAKLLMNVSRKAANAKANANAKEKAVANKVNANARAKVTSSVIKNAELLMNVSRKAANAKANKNAKEKAAANKVAANANANAKAKANVNAKEKANANAKAKANANAKANAKAKANVNVRAATPANSVRNSVTNIGNGGNSLNNNAISSAFIAPAEREKGADGKLEKQDDGKLMKRGILLTIIKMAQRTSAMSTKNLKKLMPMVNNVNSITEYHTYAWALLYDMISTLENTKFTQIQITSKTLKDIHKKLMVKNAYTTGRTSTSGGMGNRREQVFNFTDEEVVEFLFLIWLDGNHDDYIHKSFIEWLDDKNSNSIYFTNKHRALAKKFVNNFPDPRKYINNVPKFPQNVGKKKEERKKFKMEVLKNVKGYDTIRKICIETDSVWFFIHDYNGDPSRENTKNQTSVKMGFGTSSSKPPAKTSLAGNFESDLKMGIEKILNIKQSDFIFTGSREINNLKRNGIHEVSLDMETDDMILSRTITNTPSFRPYVTTANLIDPGKYMLSIGAGSDDRTLLLNAMRTQNIQILDNLQSHYHIGPVKFVIRNSKLNFLKVDLSIRKGGPPKTNNGRMPTLDFFELKINESYIKQGEKKKGATTPSTKMGKFMGDALQYMTVAVQNTYRGKPRYFASGDGSACFMNAYFCQKLKIPIRLIIDTGISDIRTIGLRNNVV